MRFPVGSSRRAVVFVARTAAKQVGGDFCVLRGRPPKMDFQFHVPFFPVNQPKTEYPQRRKAKPFTV